MKRPLLTFSNTKLPKGTSTRHPGCNKLQQINQVYLLEFVCQLLHNQSHTEQTKLGQII